MVKIFLTCVLALSLSSLALAQQQKPTFRPSQAKTPTIQGNLIYIYHPQMIDTRTGIPYDISSRSSLSGTCLAFGFDNGAAGAEYNRAISYRAVVISANGEVTGMDQNVSSLQAIRCVTYQ